VEELRNCSYFENLEQEQLNLLASFTKKKFYKKNSILFYEKEQSKSLILLISGELKVYKTDIKNNEIIMNRFIATSMIAEMAVFEEIPYPASASFETDGTVLEIDFARFKKEFLQNPEISLQFFKSLSKKIKNLEKVISLNIVLDSTSRLAKFIYENENVLADIKHYKLAQNLNMTPETLSRIFKKLVTLNLIEKESKFYIIKNREGLKTLF